MIYINKLFSKKYYFVTNVTQISLIIYYTMLVSYE